MEASVRPREEAARVAPPARALVAARDYLTLAKPKVQSLLLFTTATTMYVAGDPSVGRVALTCAGGALSAGGAGAINHYLDRDIDAVMTRTRTRPIPSGRVSPRAALTYGIALGASSFLLMSLTVGLLAASLALVGLLAYVFVYTSWLKRSTPQNIVIRGAAVVLGAAFTALATILYRRADRRAALRVYLFSLVYLALLFGAMVVDVHVG